MGAAFIGEFLSKVRQAIPCERLPLEGLQPLQGKANHDTSRVTYRRSTKDCLVSYADNYYSVPAAYAQQQLLLICSLDSRRYLKGSIILTSNKSFADWGDIFADQVLATAILDRLLHQITTINIRGHSYRLREKRKTGLFPDLTTIAQEVLATSQLICAGNFIPPKVRNFPAIDNPTSQRPRFISSMRFISVLYRYYIVNRLPTQQSICFNKATSEIC